MERLSKYEDINAVLLAAKKSLSLIEEEYHESLHKQEVPIEFLVNIKDFFRKPEILFRLFEEKNF